MVLRRIGTLFVERVEPQGGVQSTVAALDAVRSGQILVFFPEGTLTRMPGVLSFRTGAFYVAAQSGTPVVPIAIRGTRSILRGDQWFPRRGSVQIDVAPAIKASGRDGGAVVVLRDAVRRQILQRTGEPDLAGQSVEIAPPPLH